MSSVLIPSKAGFTIIEVMLVLAITGLMLVGVLVGSNIQISIQRYHDSVTSLQSQLQKEYSQVLNVANDRSNGRCAATGSTSSSRGADSSCLIVGRLITLQNGQQTITSTPVIGVALHGITDSMNSTNWKLSTDNSTPSNVSANSDSYSLRWGSTIEARSGSSTPYRYSPAFSMLIVASPSSGAISTYTDATGTTVDPQLLLNSGSQSSLPLCVKSADGLFTGGLLAVQIDAYASGASSVEVPKQSANVCAGL